MLKLNIVRRAELKDVQWLALVANQRKDKLERLITSSAILSKEVLAGRVFRNKGAFVHFRLRRDGCGVIYNIAVERGFERLGYAAGLVNYLKKKCSRITLLCSKRNVEGLAFWLKQGFIPQKTIRKWNRRKGRFSEYFRFEWKLEL